MAVTMRGGVFTTRGDAEILADATNHTVVEHNFLTDSDGHVVAQKWWELVPNDEKALGLQAGCRYSQRMTAQQRRLFFGLLLTIGGGVWAYVTAFSASQGNSSSLVPFFLGATVLAVGLYLMGRHIVRALRRNDK